MKKVIYIALIGILGFGYIPSQLIYQEVITVLLYLLWFSGFLLFKPASDNVVYSFKNTKWVYLILILLLLSTITPYLNFNQPIFRTVIALRKEFLILYVIIFLRLQPSVEEILKSLKLLSFLSIISFILVIQFPSLYVTREKLYLFIQNNETDLSIIIPPGFDFAVLYFFFVLQQILEKPTYKDIINSLVFIGFIFLVQNRSTLIGVAPFILYVFYKARFRFKYLYWGLFLALSVFYYFYFAAELWEESVTQIDNSDYNRWQALSFFLVEWKQTIYSVIFGNSAPAFGSKYLSIVEYATETRLAFISDIGLLGTYFQYGIAMLLVIYRFVFKALFSKYSPVFLKFYAFWILIVPTIHSFGLGANSYTIKWSIFFYLVIYYIHINKNSEECKFQSS
jgi:hypothetical protein